MKYLKTFEANSNWKNTIFNKIEFQRSDDIKELFYEFTDIGMSLSIDEDLKKNGFESAGQRYEYLKDDINLYKSYLIHLNDDEYDSKNMNRIIDIKQSEIELIERLQSMGFKIDYSNRGYSMFIKLCHPDDIVDKSIFMNDIISSKKVSIDDAFEKLSKTFNRIASVQKTNSNELSLYLNRKGKEKYTLDDLYNFVNKSLKDGFSVEKTKLLRKEDESIPFKYTTPVGVLVSVKNFK